MPMKGQMMNYPLTTNVIIEYGNRVFPYKEIVSKLPDGTMHRYTYHDLYKRTKKLANAMVNKLGVKQGDRVGTFAWNHYQHLELYYAIPGIGAVCHTINVRLSIEQIAFVGGSHIRTKQVSLKPNSITLGIIRLIKLQVGFFGVI